MSILGHSMSLREQVQQRFPPYLERLPRLVNIDSGSGDVDGLCRVADLIQDWTEAAGMSVQRFPVYDDHHRALGDAVVARIAGDGSRRILLVGHLDTVFPSGTAAQRPFRIDADRAFGPGVCDDKGGVLAGVSAIEALLASGATTFGELVLVATPDEEIGSVGSRSLLTALAAEADVALCLECARENGDLVSARKGVADVEIRLTGRAAHAGIEPERGANAALAAARLTIDLQALNDRWPSVTVNVGVLRAGRRANVVADLARLVVDVRAERVDAFHQALQAIHDVAGRSHVADVTAAVAVHAQAPPWERTPSTQRLLDLAGRVGADLGIAVRDAATGGSAEANLLAATGIAVLDGLGPVGGGDHSSDEWLDLTSVPDRIALIAGLIDAVAR